MTATAAPIEFGRDFLEDLTNLTKSRLRQKYSKEANSHANIRRRAKQGLCEIDPAWTEFRSFLADMGPCPIADGSVDRIDNSIRRYGPGLCRWATKEEQTRNRANTVWVEFRGAKITLAELARHLGKPYTTVHAWHQAGVAPDAMVARAGPFQASSGNFIPASLETEEKRETFLHEFECWRKSIRQRERQKLAGREVFAAVRAAKAFVLVERHLENRYIPSEHTSFEQTHQSALRIYRHALEWAQDAIRALARTHTSQAAKIYPHDEAGLRRLLLYDEWLRKPPEPQDE